jgi:uroporphyrin-III C-methyltransferase
VTGHEDPDKAESAVDWPWLAQTAGTLVILMGLERLDGICRRLIDEGLSGATPAAAVASGTLPDQQTVVASVENLPHAVRRAGLHSPAVLVIGEVAHFPHILAQAADYSLAAAV